MKWLSCAPAIVIALVEAWLLVTASIGIHPLWHTAPVSSLSEAVALRDGPDIVRRLDAGADPNAPGSVRAGWLDGEARVVTPLEAAVYSRRVELIELLLARGARPDVAGWTRLRCAAVNAGFVDSVEALDAAAPPGARSDCSGGEMFW